MNKLRSLYGLMLALVGTIPAEAASAAAPCERVQIHAVSWLTLNSIALTPDTVRQRQDQVFTSKDAAEIGSLLGRLQETMGASPVKDRSENLDARLVVDCFKPDGQVETFVASVHELRHPPDKKAVAIDEKFRKFFTLDADFAGRLRK